MRVPASGKVITDDMRQAVAAAIQHRLGDSGDYYTAQFEQQFAKFIGVRHAILTNSGSSANLLAISALELPPGSEVITTALCFPTTLAPIVQNQLVPVFVDVGADFNVNIDLLEAALSRKTRAVMLTHTLGAPFNVDCVLEFCDAHGLLLIEDCCDALGTEWRSRKVGSFGDFATFSFYPAHQITMGEGGCLVTDNAKLAKIARSYRDWGRDCWCPPGADNTCGRRFSGGYDHKYSYSHIGYNLKATDIQAALGIEQLKHAAEWAEIRNRNHDRMFRLFMRRPSLARKLYPRVANRYSPYDVVSWFGFAVTITDDAGFDANDIMRYLEEEGVGCRRVFAGNILRQPGYSRIKHRVAGKLDRTDKYHDRAFWVGCWHGMDFAQCDYVIDRLERYTYAHA